MANTNNRFLALVQQWRAGDAAAKSQLLRELQPCVLKIVQHALVQAQPLTRLHQRIQAQARQLISQRAARADQIRLLADILCHWLLNRLTPDETEVFGQMHTIAV